MQAEVEAAHANEAAVILHGIFKHAHDEYGFESNPVDGITKPQPDDTEPLQVFNVTDVWSLARAAADFRDGTIYLTAAFSGLRMGELLALRVRDVDFERSTIRVERSYSRGELTLPKSKRPRAVP